MIRFCRTIRQKMLVENRLTRYVLYAVGEVVLVVIGILIALAINNWNEAQKRNRLELSLLEEMQENLMADIHDMEDNVRFHERALRSARIILEVFEAGVQEHDSMYIHFGSVAVVPKFLVTMNSYDSMRNAGMRIIRNDSLRDAITAHYERNYAYILSWNQSEWDGLFRDQQYIYRQRFDTFDYIRKAVPVNYEALITDQEYTNYLHNRIGFIEPTIRYYNVYGIQSANNLIQLIHEELEERAEDR